MQELCCIYMLHVTLGPRSPVVDSALRANQNPDIQMSEFPHIQNIGKSENPVKGIECRICLCATPIKNIMIPEHLNRICLACAAKRNLCLHTPGYPEIRIFGNRKFRQSENPDFRKSTLLDIVTPEIRKDSELHMSAPI